MLQITDSLDGLHDGADTGLVIAAQHGGAVGADVTVGIHPGLHTLAGNDGIHVGAEHNGLQVSPAGQSGIDVAAGGLSHLVDIVSGNFAANGLEILYQALSHDGFIAGLAVDLYVFQQALQQRLLIDGHKVIPPLRFKRGPQCCCGPKYER